MHIPESQVAQVLRGMASALRPGSPLLVSMWGTQDGQPPTEHVDVTHLSGQRRLFSLRTLRTNRFLMATVGAIEWEETWDVGEDGWEYQIFRARLE